MTTAVQPDVWDMLAAHDADPSADLIPTRRDDRVAVRQAVTRAAAEDVCSVPECIAPIRVRSRALCNAHAIRLRLHGTVDRPGILERQRAQAAIKARVQTPEAFEDGECWEWPLSRNSQGYGLWYVGPSRIATRTIYALAVRPLDPTELVLHRCDNPPCYRPSHLFVGDRRANNRDAARKRRFPERMGERNSRAKVTDAQALEIVRAVEAGARTLELAAQYGISQSQVQRIARGGRGKPTYLGDRGFDLACLTT